MRSAPRSVVLLLLAAAALGAAARPAAAALACTTADREEAVLPPPGPLAGGDCTDSSSNPGPNWDPGPLYTIQVVVHVIQDTPCSQGAVSDATIASQIAVLNEDFGALPGTPGAGGVDTGLRFALATVDPNGQPTTGITRTCVTAWYNDQNSAPFYYDTLAWDPSRYLNLYTNTANNARGYVPFLPAANPAGVGTNADRVVINFLVFGRPAGVPAFSGGRTSTHEIGHFFGLFHMYYNGCGTATPPACYTTGDTLCDTTPDDTSHHGCLTTTTSACGVPIPAENYMELSDDTCMTGFTREQARRIRCTLATYRPGLIGGTTVFSDGFESGDPSHWSQVQP